MCPARQKAKVIKSLKVQFLNISSFLGSCKLEEQCMRSVFQRGVARSFNEQLFFSFLSVSLIDELYCFIFHHSESRFLV